MVVCTIIVGEEAGGFDDEIDTQFAPGQLGGIAFSEALEGVLTSGDGVTVDFDFTLELAVHCIVLEQVSKVVCGNQVIDCYQFDTVNFVEGTSDQAADTSKTVDCNFDRHDDPPKY